MSSRCRYCPQPSQGGGMGCLSVLFGIILFLAFGWVLLVVLF